MSIGGVTMPSFQLILGERVPRARPLSNAAHPLEFQQNEGSHTLLVWSSWRLQTASDVLTTSDDATGSPSIMTRLVGAVVSEVSCTAPANDLRVGFACGDELVVFCDNHGADPSASRNWELWVPSAYVSAGLAGVVQYEVANR